MGRQPQRTWARRRRSAAAAVAALTFAAGFGACGDDDDDSAARTTTTAARSADTAAVTGKWKTWVLSAPDQIKVPAPPPEGSTERETELAEVKKLAGERTDAVEEQVKKWSGAVPSEPWTVINNEYIASQAKNPPLSSRNLAYTHVAMYDALVAASHWQEVYERAAPAGVEALVPATGPSYPSEHAAMAGAASRVLTHLYPTKPGPRLEELAEEVADSRVAAGANSRSDVEAGLALGRAVAEAVIAKADADGADSKWDGKRPAGIGNGPEFWEPPPGSVSPPIEPLAGRWKTWVLTSGDQLRSSMPAPPAYGSPEFKASAQRLIDMKRDLTDDQKRIAKFWEGAEGTPLPAGIVNQVILDDVRPRNLSGAEATRVFALVNIAMADAGGAVWDAKFAYWYPRPENAIRDSGIDRTWSPHLPTPRFPAYPSGSAGYAGAAEGVMTALFPADAAKHRARAEEQARSRQYAGIHWDFDAVSLEMGRDVARLVIEKQGLKPAS